jgi:PIN domain nuclease of toxin-antitoxin system
MTFVLDACGMIAYLRQEPGAPVVDATVRDPAHLCLAHAVNLCEVFYDFLRVTDETTAEAAIQDLFSVGVQCREDLDAPFWKDVGRLKAPGGVSLADCFCVALARRFHATVLTSDHNEFDPVAAQGLCVVQFIR